MTDDLEKPIQDYIEGHNICTIAVSEGNNPSAHTVYYVSKDLRIYFESNPNSDKIRVLKSNPQISLTIDEDYRDWKILEAHNFSNITDEFHKKFPNLNDMGGIPENHVFVEVTPKKIYYMDFSKELGHKSAYLPKDKGTGFLSKVNW